MSMRPMPPPHSPTARQIVNDCIPSRDQDGDPRRVSDDAVNESDSALVHFREEQANIYIRDQPR